MQLAAFKTEVMTSDDLAPQAFKIGNSAKMFALLSDKLYSDKIKAVVREYACNALDAHASIGQTRPFLISAPSRVSPMFLVRDFGPGLSHDDVMGLFTTFFDSSKSGSNDQIGGFGLGSKSGFAYADAFTVVSIFQSVRSVYACFRGGDGVPQVTVVETAPTDDEDGFEVRVPVASQDFYAFGSRLSNVLAWFPAGSFAAYGFETRPTTFLIDHNDWFVQGDGSPVAIMGPVAYPLDWSQIPCDALPTTVGLRFGIGDLDLAPSREGLSYDPKTIARIKLKADIVSAEIKQVLQAQLDTQTPYNRLKLHEQLCNNRLRTMLPEAETLYIKIESPITKYEANNRGSNLRSGGSSQLSVVLTSTGTIGRVKFYFNDLDPKIKQPRYVARMNAAHNRSTAYLVHPSPQIPNFAALQALIPDAPEHTFTALSTLEPPSVQKRTAIYSNVYRTFSNSSSFILQPNQDVTQLEGLFIPFSGPNPESFDDQALLNLQQHDQPVYGLTKKMRAQLDMSQFTSLADHLIDRANGYLADPNLMRAYNANRTYQQVPEDLRPIYEQIRMRALPGPFGKLYDSVKSLSADISTSRDHRDGLYFLSRAHNFMKLPEPIDEHNILKQLETFRTKNPLIMRLINRPLTLSGDDDTILKDMKSK